MVKLQRPTHQNPSRTTPPLVSLFCETVAFSLTWSIPICLWFLQTGLQMALLFILGCAIHVASGICLSSLNRRYLPTLWHPTHPNSPLPFIEMSFIEMCVKVPTAASSTSRQAAETVQSSSPVPAESSSSSPPQAGMPAHRVPPLIRLQVWHFSKAGRNFAFTRSLTEKLSKVDLPGWLVQPANSASTGRNRRDEFVPAVVSIR